MTPKRLTPLFVAAVGASLAAGCNQKKNGYVPPPPPEVNVQKPLVETTTVQIDFPGRTRA